MELSGLKTNPDFRFEQITVDDGLPQNSINSIYQDSDGFMWFATQDGLCRYDGFDYKVFRPEPGNPESISDNFIWSLTEDREGFLWFCTRNAVNRMNRLTGKCVQFYPSKPKKFNYPNDIYCTEDSIIIVFRLASYMISLNDLTSESPFILQAEHEASELNNFRGVLEIAYLSKDGAMFLTESGLVLKTKKKTIVHEMNTISLSGPDRGNSFFKTDDGNWLVATDDGLFCIEKPGFKTRPVFHKFLEDLQISSLTSGPENTLWIGSNYGLLIFDKLTKKTQVINPLNQAQNTPSPFLIHSVFQDRDGTMWIGTANEGLIKYDPGTELFHHLDKSDGLPHNLVWAVQKSSDNFLWVGTQNGLVKISPPSGKKTGNRFREYFSGKRITALFESSKTNLYAGVAGSGLWVNVAGSEKFRRVFTGDPDQLIFTDITEDSAGRIWCSTYKGIFKIENDQLKQVFLNDSIRFFTNFFLSAYTDIKGQLWFGGNDGFYHMDPSTNIVKWYSDTTANFEYRPSHNFISGFSDPGDNHLYISTFGSGIDILDKKTGRIKNISEREGLANNVCSGILSDDKGRIWVSTNRGISRYAPETGEIVNFSREDGMPFNEATLGSLAKDDNGFIYCGTSLGLVWFHPDSIDRIPVRQPRLTGLTINYLPANYPSSQPKTITLETDAKIVDFQFSPMVFRNPGGLEFSYLLEEVDESWSRPIIGKNHVSYSTLPMGTHSFKIRNRYPGGEWSPELKINLVVERPIYLTWWFISICSISIFGFALLVVRQYTSIKIKQQLAVVEQRRLMQAERERISRNLHDHVGSSLTYIISTLDNLQHRKGQENSQGLNHLSDFSRNTMAQLRESIWVLRQQQITLSELSQRIREQVASVISLRESLNLTIDDSACPDCPVHAEVTLNLLAIIKEVITNSVKHSNATEISVKFNREGTGFSVQIDDNGTGNATIIPQPGHFGLQSMKERAADIGCTFNIYSNERGTTVQLLRIPEMPDSISRFGEERI